MKQKAGEKVNLCLECCRLIRRNAVLASEGRSSFHGFLREILKHENKPEVVVDRGFCTGFTKLFKIQARLVREMQ